MCTFYLVYTHYKHSNLYNVHFTWYTYIINIVTCTVYIHITWYTYIINIVTCTMYILPGIHILKHCNLYSVHTYYLVYIHYKHCNLYSVHTYYLVYIHYKHCNLYNVHITWYTQTLQTLDNSLWSK